jgi:hypothetical protein
MGRFMKGKDNLMLISLPGMGATILAKLWQQLHSQCGYITGAGFDIRDKNIIDINPESGEDFEIIDNYYKSAEPATKFLVMISNPGVLDEEVYTKSYFSQHTYVHEYLEVLDRSATAELVGYYGGEKSKENMDKIYKLSGGIGRLIKYLSTVNKDLNLDKLLEDERLIGICNKLAEAYLNSSVGDRKKIGIVDKKGKIAGQLLDYFVAKQNNKIDIVVERDLTVVENGEKGNRLARTERDILLKQVENGGFISREQVAEIKWGKSEYSDFSDQALNKAMRRINDKLKQYNEKTVWKTGYQLKEI